MGGLAEARVSRLKNEIIPKILKDGKFRKANANTKIENIVISQAEAGTDHWCSATMFVEVHLKNKGEPKLIEKLVAKYPPISEKFRKFLLSDVMYKNEGAIYQHVIPKYLEFLQKQSIKLGDSKVAYLLDDMFPVCYYAEFDPEKPEHAVVILNDVRVDGYQLAHHRVHLDVNHVQLCLIRLARYHGVGYAYKLTNEKEYKEIMSKLTHARFSAEEEEKKCQRFKLYSQRPIRRLIKDKVDDVKLEDLIRLDQIFEDTHGVMQYLTRKCNSAVLCHGDFCVNNLLFQYDKSGDPENVIFIDFQTPFYSSPAIDLSFFFLISTDYHFRNQHFNELFHLYHSTVIDTMSEVLGRPIDEPGFTFHDFRKDYTDHAAYGYVTAAFFLPVMMNIHKESFSLEEEMKKDEGMSVEERRKEVESAGGEVVTQILVSLFTEMYDKKCFDDLLNNFSIDTHL